MRIYYIYPQTMWKNLYRRYHNKGNAIVLFKLGGIDSPSWAFEEPLCALSQSSDIEPPEEIAIYEVHVDEVIGSVYDTEHNLIRHIIPDHTFLSRITFQTSDRRTALNLDGISTHTFITVKDKLVSLLKLTGTKSYFIEFPWCEGKTIDINLQQLKKAMTDQITLFDKNFGVIL